MSLQEIVLPDGTTRKLGNKIPDPSAPKKLKCKVYGDTPNTPLVLRSQWDDLLAGYSPGLEAPGNPPTHDQNGVGQCNADSTALSQEWVRMRQGLPYVRLSGADLYARINGGVDEGSLLEDAMHEMLTNGVGTAATCGELWKQGSYKGPASAEERAKYRVLEAYECPTFDHVFSALLCGFVVQVGVLWYDNYNPDGDGWVPKPRGNAGGHALSSYKPTKRNGVYGACTHNSWGDNWGIQGKFVLPEWSFDGPVGGWWALRAVTDEGNVIPQEK